MSWTVITTGTAEEIGKAFDAQRDLSASYGMIESEQRDIDEVRDVAMQFASTYDRVTVSAGGHWTIYGKDDPRNQFGRVHLTIDAAPPPPAADAETPVVTTDTTEAAEVSQ